MSEALAPRAPSAPGVSGPAAGDKGKAAAGGQPGPREQLCQRLEAAAKTQDFEDADGLLAGLREKWHALGTLPSADPLQKRFERAAARFWGSLTLGAHCNGWVAGPGGRPAGQR